MAVVNFVETSLYSNKMTKGALDSGRFSGIENNNNNNESYVHSVILHCILLFRNLEGDWLLKLISSKNAKLQALRRKFLILEKRL